MTGSANDNPAWEDHIRSKARNKAITEHFRDPSSPLKRVIVRDILLAFSEKLEAAIGRYQSRSIATAQVIEELLNLSRQMREAQARGEALNLTEDEIAFYDALDVNDSAVKVLGNDQLREIAETVRRNATIDWHLREQARAHLRRMVKRVRRRHEYPPDKQKRASHTVIE